jgi:molybdopterin/thiamine biosynthesis adenylyltransferase
VIEIRFREELFDQLQSHLRLPNHHDEEGALLLAHQAQLGEDFVLVVNELIKVPDSGFIHKGPGGLTINPEFLAPVIKHARVEGMCVILTHSHPFSDQHVRFSAIDDAGEETLMPKLQERIPDRVHGTMVFGRRSVAARAWLPHANSSQKVDRVSVIGKHIDFPTASNGVGEGVDERFARQTLAFTANGQRRLATIRTAIVGLGGIGSQVFQNLVYLGLRHFVLIDHDVVEPSNLSRLVGATADDAREKRLKVNVMKRLAATVDPSIDVTAVAGNVYNAEVAATLKACDVVFSCTDTMVSRMVLTRFPKQFFVPLIDVGVNIQIRDGKLDRIGGRVMVLGPDDPCLDCLEYLNHEVLTQELAELGVVPPTPYTSGLRDPVPAVVSFNGTLAGLAVSEFLRLVLPDFPTASETTFQVLDGIDGVVRRVGLRSTKSCGICDEYTGKADAAELPVLRRLV